MGLRAGKKKNRSKRKKKEMKGGSIKKKQKFGNGSERSSLKSPGSLSLVGELNGNGCLITSEAECSQLWWHGCFGRGLMSRSRPERLSGSRQQREATSAASPFYGSGPVKSPRALLGVANEPVHLTPEETLYLMHVFGCLRLEPPLPVEQVWRFFVEAQPRMPLLYFAYHHYRRLGWVVRAGSKMGCDLVLYQDNPGLVHAQHSILVLDNAQPMPSWPELLGIGRVSENVRKTLVLCRVQLGASVRTLDDVLNGSHVAEELVYRRWATNRTRDEKGDNDEPDWSND